MNNKSTCFVMVIMLWLSCACTTLKPQYAVTDFTPRLNRLAPPLSTTKITELTVNKLIATNLVSVLIQEPNLNVETTTLQVSKPTSTFGGAVIRAVEDAGYGIQLVSEDQGPRYLSYQKRQSETESGLVTEFVIAVGEVLVKRAYRFDGHRVFPSSLLAHRGFSRVDNLYLNDLMFFEQGGVGNQFVYGLQALGLENESIDIHAVVVKEHDFVNYKNRTQASELIQMVSNIARLKKHAIPADSLTIEKEVSRTILIITEQPPNVIGVTNKLLVSQLAKNMLPEDKIGISTCVNAGGENDLSKANAIRLLEELLFLGVDADHVHIMPCNPTIYGVFSKENVSIAKLVQLR